MLDFVSATSGALWFYYTVSHLHQELYLARFTPSASKVLIEIVDVLSVPMMHKFFFEHTAIPHRVQELLILFNFPRPRLNAFEMLQISLGLKAYPVFQEALFHVVWFGAVLSLEFLLAGVLVDILKNPRI